MSNKRFIIQHPKLAQIVMSVLENFADIYLRGMRGRSMRSGMELARQIQLTDLPKAGNLSNRCSGVQIPRDIYTFWALFVLYEVQLDNTCKYILWNHTMLQSSFPCSEVHLVNNFFVCSKDEDRIFTNLYGRHDWKLSGAIKRVMIVKHFVIASLYIGKCKLQG